ncbi:hypothetical protein P3T18_003351 [Paraburkholderia sp. GAS199]
MSSPSRLKALIVLLLSFVLLFVGLAVTIGVFGLLVKLFGSL